MLLKMGLLPHSHCSIEHSEWFLSEGTLTDEKRSLALFVKQMMSVCLKDYEYKIRVISADEQEAIELNESVDALKPYQLYVLIEAKNVFEQVAKVEKFTNKRVFVVNQNLICLAEGANDDATSSEGTNNKISKHFNIDESNKKVVFRKSKTVLPLWLDKYLFEELGAIYAPKHTRYEYNLDLNEDELKVYLGTYFPRSYAEMFCIFDNMFQNNAVLQVFNDKKELNFFDFCCGTGGELIGLLSAIDKYFPNEKNINIVACDGNNLALDYLHKIIEKAGKLSKHSYKFLPICKKIYNLDDIGLLEIPFGSFDIALCDKVCCEFISHGVYNQSYGYLADYLSKKISKDGLFVILDVTTKCEKTKMFYPQMMNLQINNFVRDSDEFETLLPLSCAMYKDCSIPCFTQQTFKVTHMRKKDDESRVCYRILCYKKLKEHLFSNYFVGNKTYVINPIRYQQHADGAYCSNSQANKELIDSFNINN